jgi:hypothetical protein
VVAAVLDAAAGEVGDGDPSLGDEVHAVARARSSAPTTIAARTERPRVEERTVVASYPPSADGPVAHASV